MPKFTITEEEQEKAEHMAEIWDVRAQIYHDTQRIGIPAIGYCKTNEEAESAGTTAKSIYKAINFLILGNGNQSDYDQVQKAVADFNALDRAQIEFEMEPTAETQPNVNQRENQYNAQI